MNQQRGIELNIEAITHFRMAKQKEQKKALKWWCIEMKYYYILTRNKHGRNERRLNLFCVDVSNESFFWRKMYMS